MTNWTICTGPSRRDLEDFLGLGQVVDAERRTARAQRIDLGVGFEHGISFGAVGH